MKKQLTLILFWLLCHSIIAQNDTTNSPENFSPITTTGISLPQLITTNINRSNLQFGVNLSEGLERPNLSVNSKKFVSDSRKQLTITGGANMNHNISFSRNENQKLYSVNSISLGLGANLKLFNKDNYFIEIGTQNSINKSGGLSDFDFISTSNSLTFAVGKGRIDFVNDGVSALAITEKLSEYQILKRSLSAEEYSLLTQKIANLKNRRKFVNRSYPFTESEEIQDLLLTFGVIDKDSDITAIIDDAYRYEPMIDRTSGSQFRMAVTGSLFYSDLFSHLNSKNVIGSISYMIHTPINSKWQYDKGITGYAVADDSRYVFPTFSDTKLRKAGFGINNNLHYLVDNRMRLSFLTSTGYNFTNKINTFDPFDNPYFENKGFYLSARSEVEFQISRTMSTSFGINLDITPENTYTGLNLGLKF